MYKEAIQKGDKGLGGVNKYEFEVHCFYIKESFLFSHYKVILSHLKVWKTLKSRRIKHPQLYQPGITTVNIIYCYFVVLVTYDLNLILVISFYCLLCLKWTYQGIEIEITFVFSLKRLKKKPSKNVNHSVLPILKKIFLLTLYNYGNIKIQSLRICVTNFLGQELASNQHAFSLPSEPRCQQLKQWSRRTNKAVAQCHIICNDTENLYFINVTVTGQIPVRLCG